jgi:cytosine/adenosine deaminase-related metal-dependent hydrolase
MVSFAVIPACIENALRADTARHDLVITGARVIDPASGLDGRHTIGITGGRIAAITTGPLAGAAILDAAGLVVGPGLIDLHSHGMNVASNWLQAFDGVTSVLELEGGAWPVDAAYRRLAAEGRPINFGFASGWEIARRHLFGDAGAGLLPASDSKRVVDAMRQGLDQGALGIALTPGYIPASNRSELAMLGGLAAEVGVPSFSHVRFKNLSDPGSVVEGVGEAIAVAAMTGAHIHICHINSAATRQLPQVLAMIDRARRAGVPVSTEAYPWGAGSTSIDAPFLAPDNLPLLGLLPSAIEYLTTGERIAGLARLTELRDRDPAGRVLVHYLDEDRAGDMALLDAAILAPGSIIASDAVPYSQDGREFSDPIWPLPPGLSGHPRSAATFMRVLKRQVVDRGRMTWLEFFRRAALLPAQMLEASTPAMRERGRITPGAIADLVVIDPALVQDHASYAMPALPSSGVRHLLVSGQAVIRDGQLLMAARPGRAIRRGAGHV